jgi:uncharacterized OB-fold protein
MADLPIKEGLFYIPRSPKEKPYLIGSRCRICGYTSFPKNAVCVRCRRDDTMEEIKLGPYGSLETYAVMRVGPPDFPPPYVIGYVKMEEGPVVFTLLTGCEPEDDALELGQDMELVIEKVREDGAGNNLIGWKFRPVERTLR